MRAPRGRGPVCGGYLAARRDQLFFLRVELLFALELRRLLVFRFGIKGLPDRVADSISPYLLAFILLRTSF